MAKSEKRYTMPQGNQVAVRKDHYLGLWNVWYVDGIGMKWAGPFKTKKEAVAHLEDRLEFAGE